MFLTEMHLGTLAVCSFLTQACSYIYTDDSTWRSNRAVSYFLWEKTFLFADPWTAIITPAISRRLLGLLKVPDSQKQEQGHDLRVLSGIYSRALCYIWLISSNVFSCSCPLFSRFFIGKNPSAAKTPLRRPSDEFYQLGEELLFFPVHDCICWHPAAGCDLDSEACMHRCRAFHLQVNNASEEKVSRKVMQHKNLHSLSRNRYEMNEDRLCSREVMETFHRADSGSHRLLK